ncbi:hypothetical protein F5Y13DRAFT_185695 [Hypoxylon sp. FL1857]|nr:hypothetical protein F5Y13DRAFT_185695 [Hypoxylon sp. FL1857]
MADGTGSSTRQRLRSSRGRPSGVNRLRELSNSPQSVPPTGVSSIEFSPFIIPAFSALDLGRDDQVMEDSDDDRDMKNSDDDRYYVEHDVDSQDVEDIYESEYDLFPKIAEPQDHAIEEDDSRDDPPVCEPGSSEDVDCLELEFVLAVCSRDPDQDPHPDENRRISRRLAQFTYEDPELDAENRENLKSYTIRKILKILSRRGLHAHEPDGVQVPDELDSDIGDEPLPDWLELIDSFEVRSPYKPGRSNYNNGIIGYSFAGVFAALCATEGYDLRTISGDAIEVACNRVRRCLEEKDSWKDGTDMEQVLSYFAFKLSAEKLQLHQLEAKALELAEDPNHVRVPGLIPRYRAWTAVEDLRVSGDGFDSMTADRYDIPPNRQGQIPMEQYVWFGAEVVSPVLPANSDETAAIIRRACDALRVNLRIHKPMEYSTGFHVHLGHMHGWNLLQIKRFITLWFLTEGVLIHIHRKDRESEYMDPWIAKFGEGTKLAQTLWHPDTVTRHLVYCLPQTDPRTRARNIEEMERHVASIFMTDRQQEFIRNIWLYTSIDDLADAVAGGYNAELGGLMRPAVRMRVTGHKRTNEPNTRDDANADDPSQARNAQTLEVRTMHGTVDANHINHWIVVLRRFVYYTRHASPDEFRDLTGSITGFATQPEHLGQLLQILQVPNATQRYFYLPHNRDTDPNTGQSWFTYPDKDRVDWEEPFAYPYHGSTHGAEYDILENNYDYFPPFQ